LSAGDDKGFGVDATAQEVHGCLAVRLVCADALDFFIGNG